ncbi:predicted protein [Sclerotinia sclerotiorum 1980 UF-70]|uniref:Uncharacterized protein n=1 Tax=Sclerotinia sclerotiorum (strain ATCC 18683 / 1980 / Ss-1) TaxID=665079 RepID=A7EPK1_SCLS1|nr:predicted protein [Sclerotinia sclerotiorum 1980 UF-70]EDO04767.1 predicted protein [Sclerotinia sclerotiorum 1980 UF-70]
MIGTRDTGIKIAANPALGIISHVPFGGLRTPWKLFTISVPEQAEFCQQWRRLCVGGVNHWRPVAKYITYDDENATSGNNNICTSLLEQIVGIFYALAGKIFF